MSVPPRLPDDVIARAHAGDAAAWEAIVKHHEPRLRAYVLSRTDVPSDAEDVVQETWLVAWRYLTAPARAGQDFPEGAIRSWLRRTAEYLLLQGWKRQRLSASSSLDELLEARHFEPVAPNTYDADRPQREAARWAQQRQYEAARVLERNLALLLASAPSPERHGQVESLRRELVQVREGVNP